MEIEVENLEGRDRRKKPRFPQHALSLPASSPPEPLSTE